jgi:chaperone LolA
MRVRLLIAGLLWCWPFVTLAGPADDDGARLVAEFVNDMATLQGRFEQSLLAADGEVVERTRGTLEIQRPGQFRWAYTEPYEQILVADGLNIWSYDLDLAQVTVKPQHEALANTPAMLLSGAPDAMQQFNNDGSFVEAGTTGCSSVRLIRIVDSCALTWVSRTTGSVAWFFTITLSRPRSWRYTMLS